MKIKKKRWKTKLFCEIRKLYKVSKIVMTIDLNFTKQDSLFHIVVKLQMKRGLNSLEKQKNKLFTIQKELKNVTNLFDCCIALQASDSWL